MTKQEAKITEMGKLSQAAYQKFGNDGLNNGLPLNYFDDAKIKYDLNSSYQIIDYLDTNADTQALFLQDNNTKECIIAFRGTGEVWDGIVDLKISFKNINEQYADASSFTQKALATIANDKQCSIDKAKSYLTLTGHSLGGILTQKVSANSKTKRVF